MTTRVWSSRVGAVVGFTVLVALGAACSSGDRPPALDDTGSGAAAQIAAGDATDDPCEPGSHRDCHLYFYDDRGQLQCPLDIELCREDGSGYYPCGTYVVGDDGEPVPRAPSANVEASGEPR